MKNIKINDSDISINMTSLQGYLTINYFELIERLGKPKQGYDKSLAEWHIQAENEFGQTIVANIYDWKNYGGNAENIINWNIGGKSSSAVDLVKYLFPNNNTITYSIF